MSEENAKQISRSMAAIQRLLRITLRFGMGEPMGAQDAVVFSALIKNDAILIREALEALDLV